MNVLAIGAHPDDAEYGCAGSLIQLSSRGHDIYLLICTAGEEGGDATLRKTEQQASAELMGIREVFWGGYRDTRLPEGKDLIDPMERIIGQVKPDLILLNYWDDTHQDHRALAKAALSATRYIRNVLFYETPTSEGFNPQIYMNIGDVLEKKVLALRAHASQVTKTNIEGLSIVEIAHANATFRGIQGRVKFAEAFVALRYFIDIPPCPSPDTDTKSSKEPEMGMEEAERL